MCELCHTKIYQNTFIVAPLVWGVHWLMSPSSNCKCTVTVTDHYFQAFTEMIAKPAQNFEPLLSMIWLLPFIHVTRWRVIRFISLSCRCSIVRSVISLYCAISLTLISLSLKANLFMDFKPKNGYAGSAWTPDNFKRLLRILQNGSWGLRGPQNHLV